MGHGLAALVRVLKGFSWVLKGLGWVIEVRWFDLFCASGIGSWDLGIMIGWRKEGRRKGWDGLGGGRKIWTDERMSWERGIDSEKRSGDVGFVFIVGLSGGISHGLHFEMYMF